MKTQPMQIECVCGHAFSKELIASEVGGNIMSLKEAGKAPGYFGNAAKRMIHVKCPDCERTYLAALGRFYNGYKILGIEHEDKMFTQGRIVETKPQSTEEQEAPKDKASETAPEAPEKQDTQEEVDQKSLLMVKLLDISDKKQLIAELKEMGVEGLKGNMTRQTIITKAKEHFGIDEDFQA